MSNTNNQTFMETIKSLSLQRVYNETKEYCINFAKRRPIVATLIALELGSWAYLGLKKFSQKFIWWNTVLELEIKGDYTMKPPDPFEDLINPAGANRLSFLQLLHTIHGAGKDNRVRALLLRIETEFIIGVGQCEELRATLLQFKEKYNKVIIVYADNISSWGVNGFRHYYIASVASKIYMSDDGLLNLGPQTIDFPFLKTGLKEKLDITVEVRRRAQYKSAFNMFARDEFDEFHKEQYLQLSEHIEKNFIDTVSKARLLKPYSIPKEPKVIEYIKWIAQQIINENDNNLEFKLDDDDIKSIEKQNNILSNIKEEKSDELDENYSGSGNKFEDEWNSKLMYLVHCWSWNDGNYKHPKLFVVLQFYHKIKKENVFYKATLTYPSKRLGKLQRGASGMVSNEIKTDEKGNEISKELTYSILNGFKARECYIELVKPGDIDVPKADRKLDEDNERGEMRDNLAQQHIVIRRNVNDIVHHGSYTSQEAEDIGLIDGRCTYSDIYKKIIPQILGLVEKKISYLYLHRYYQRVYKSKLSNGIPGIKNNAQPTSTFGDIAGLWSAPTKIAYIGATNGAIIDGESTKDKIGSTTICRQLRAARKKKAIKGIILHLDTPGGSATACHNMCSEILACIAESKPVIAVQSNIAASGGYYLSAPCSYVISSPSTITGSIGVIVMKLMTRTFWKEKLGINYDRVSTDDVVASMFSQLDGFGEYERVRVEQALTQWYTRFKKVIATTDARDMELDKLESVAKGQVWLGTQALEIGLVDELGGLYDAMIKMKELLNIASYKKIKLVNPLGKITIWDILMGTTPENENDFSVPRNSFGFVLDTVCNFVRPVSWIKYSGCANLLVSNIVSSPILSSVMLMGSGNLNGNNGMINLMNRNKIFNDLQFMVDELKFYQNNAILMYSSSTSYFHHVLQNGH